MDRQLALKRQQVEIRIKTQKDELALKHKENKDKEKQFEVFVEASEVMRRRGMEKYEIERKLNIQKNQEIEDMMQKLMQLKVRQHKLRDRLPKYKIYEDYLMILRDHLPESFLDYGAESIIMPLVLRHKSLSVTKRALEDHGQEMAQELERAHQRLDLLKQQHYTGQLMANKKLSELHSRLETLKEQNKEREMSLLMNQGKRTVQAEEVASLVIAVQNLGDQCHLVHTYGPLKDIGLLRMMDMVKEYILEKTDTERKARLMDPAVLRKGVASS